MCAHALITSAQYLYCRLLKRFFLTCTGDAYARCTICWSDFGIAYGGRSDETTHVEGKHHIEMAAASSSSMSMAPFCRPQTSLKFIEAEILWSKLIAMHNIPFQASDHATKLFHRMFPDSEVVQKFSCGHTKTAAIIKTLGPHYLEKTLTDMSKLFSVLMDESNED